MNKAKAAAGNVTKPENGTDKVPSSDAAQEEGSQGSTTDSNANCEQKNEANVEANNDQKSEPKIEPKVRHIGSVPEMGECDISTVDVSVAKPIAEDSPELQKIKAEDAQQFPLWAWALLMPMTVFTVVYAIVKKEIGTCNPAAYWIWYFSPVPILGVFMIATGAILKKKHRRKVAAGYVFKGDGEESPDYRDLKWTNETLKKYPTIAVLAGVAAGLLGIGGGMVIGPLFIQLDMQPKVGSSSCAFMIFWTAISGVVQYYLAGKLGLEFILYGVAIGFISGQMGQRMVDRMLRKSGRPSYVIFLLGGIVLTACVAMTGTGIYKLAKSIADGTNFLKFDTYDFQCHD